MTSSVTPQKPGVFSKVTTGITHAFGYATKEELSAAKTLFLKTLDKAQSAEALCKEIKANRKILDPACKKIQTLMKQPFADETHPTYNTHKKELNIGVIKPQATLEKVHAYLDALNNFHAKHVKEEEKSDAKEPNTNKEKKTEVSQRAIKQFVADERDALAPFFAMIIQINNTHTVDHSIHGFRKQLHEMKATIATHGETRESNVKAIQTATTETTKTKGKADAATITAKVMELVQKPFDALAKKFAELKTMEHKAPEGLLSYKNRQHRLPADTSKAKQINIALANASVYHKAEFDKLKGAETKAIDGALSKARSVFGKHGDLLIHAMDENPTRLRSYNIYDYVGFKAAKDFVEADKGSKATFDAIIGEVKTAVEKHEGAEKLQKEVEAFQGRFDKLRKETEDNFKAQFANFKKDHSVIDESWFSAREKADLKAMTALLTGWDKQFKVEHAKLQAKATASAKAEAKTRYEGACKAYVEATTKLYAKIEAQQADIKKSATEKSITAEVKRVKDELATAAKAFQEKTADAHKSAGNKVIREKEALVDRYTRRYKAALQEGTPTPKDISWTPSWLAGSVYAKSKEEKSMSEKTKVEKTDTK